VIPSVTVRRARVSFFLDVIHVSIRRELAIAADDAAAAECRESEEPNKATHTSLRAALEQFPYRGSYLSAATKT
jgi:hypothetical protein